MCIRDRPIYDQIYSQIKALIISGELQTGEPLPSIRNLAKDLRISVITTKREQICTAVQMASVPGYWHFRISLSIGGTMQSITDPMENVVRRASSI